MNTSSYCGSTYSATSWCQSMHEPLGYTRNSSGTSAGSSVEPVSAPRRSATLRFMNARCTTCVGSTITPSLCRAHARRSLPSSVRRLAHSRRIKS